MTTTTILPILDVRPVPQTGGWDVTLRDPTQPAGRDGVAAYVHTDGTVLVYGDTFDLDDDAGFTDPADTGRWITNTVVPHHGSVARYAAWLRENVG